MSEKRLQKYVLDNVDYTGHWDFVESKFVTAGFPDLDFCVKGVEGNIELKYGSDKKPPTLRPTQCAWFRRRAGVGGNCWLLLGWEIDDGNCFYLIPGKKVPFLVGARTRERWTENAAVSWAGQIRWNEFIDVITRPATGTG